MNAKMMMIMAVVTATVMLSAPIIPSLAQGPEGPPLSSCEASINKGCSDTGSRSEDERLQTCCAVVKFAAEYDTECICLMLQALDAAENTTVNAQMNDLFSYCHIPFTVDSLCSPGSNTLPTPTPGSNIGVIIGASVAGGVALVASLIGCTIFIRKRVSKSDVENYAEFQQSDAGDSRDVTRNQDVSTDPKVAKVETNNKNDFLIPESLKYDLADIQAATNNFSKENKIGRGGFGAVYKGTLAKGQQIAVKRLAQGSGQGDKEFQTEIVVLAKLQHKNLVKLLGFCIDNEEALLVYELMANKSLDYFLFDDQKRAGLNWLCRFEIIKGVSRGLLYLHEDAPVQTMHRDLKAANVLLDAEMYPKIADFGLARICDAGQTHINPTRVVGTHGYMAPEYLFHGQFSAKSDVYALGVLILEIVSGRRISGSSFNQQGGEGLLSYAWKCWEDEEPLEIMDPLLKDSFSSDEVIKCVQLGLLCVQENSNLRPTMSTVVHMLNSHTGAAGIMTPQHPAYIYSGSSQQTTTMSSRGDTSSTVTRM